MLVDPMQERVVIRTRDASGSEHIEDILRGIDAHHAPQFDEQWRQQAEHVLPDVGPRTRRRLEPADPYPRQQQQQQYALPHNPGMWHGLKLLWAGLTACLAPGEQPTLWISM